MKVLVTGNKGYIGAHLEEALIEKYGKENVFGLDEVSDPSEDLCRDAFEAFKQKGIKFDVIFHLAAYPRVQWSVENPHLSLYNNIVSSMNVFEYARENDCRVVYSGSSSVIGNGKGPESPYALSKLVPEAIGQMYAKLYGLDFVTLRYFNVYYGS